MHLKGSLIVEDRHFVFADRPEFAAKGFQVRGSLSGEVKHDVAHFGFDGAGAGGRLSHGSFRGWSWGGGSGICLRLKGRLGIARL
jgi:hypothetical protein